MHAHTRVIVAAIAHAFIVRKKVAGVYDHASGRHLRIAAEARGEYLQGFDGERSARFGGKLPEIYDAGDEAFLSVEIDGDTARGYDRDSSSAFSAKVTDRLVQLYDHARNEWFAFDVHVV